VDPILGTIIMFGFTFAPRGWMFCQGQLLPIAQYQAVFALLGTTYGGNGTTNFALPDMRGRVPIGMGTGPGLSPYVQGEMVGSENSVIAVNQMPAHTHAATATSTSTSTSTSMLYGENIAGTASLPANKLLAGSAAGNPYTVPTPAQNKAMAAESIETTTTTATTTTVVVAPAGSGLPVPNIQPSLCLNYCIAIEGIFPSRN
jgi:microcystin-dependent protein